jgi:tetratricopeptide (TPR) repeat protein
VSSMSAPRDTDAQTQSRSLRALYYELGCGLIENRRHVDAVDALGHALREAGDVPRIAQVGRQLAAARVAIGDHDGALEAALEALLDADPDEVPEALQQVKSLIANARLAAHSPLLADPRWSALLTRSALPARIRVDVGVLVGQALLQIDNPRAAEPLLAAAAQLETADLEPLWVYGRVLARLDRYEEAVATLEAAQHRALDRNQVRAASEIAIDLGRAFLAMNQFDRALSSLPDTRPMDDTLHAQALQVRSVALLANGAAEEALAASSEAVKLVPGDLNVLCIQAQALVALHRDKEAMLVIDKGLERNPTDEGLQLLRLLTQVETQAVLDTTDRWQRHLRRFDRGVLSTCLAGPSWRGRDDDGRAHYARAVLFWYLGDSLQAAAECRRALELGLGEGLPEEPDAPVHALLAESLEKQNELEPATKSRFDAGLAYFFRSAFEEAARHLETVIARQPEHPRASWFLSSSLQIQAAGLNANSASGARDGQEALLAKRVSLLSRAEQVWDQAACALPDQIESWAYAIRASISEDGIRLQPQDRFSLLWDGVAFVERGLVMGSQNTYLWAVLGRLYRRLELDACCRAANDAAYQIAPDDLDILEERIIFCSNTGDYDGALEAVEQREALLKESALGQAERSVQNSWHLACRAYAAEGTGEYEEALRLVTRSLEMRDGDPWIQQIAGRAHRMLGHRESSQEVFAEILARPDNGEPSWKQTAADALFALGRPDEALEAYERWRNATGRRPRDLELVVGLCHLLRGDVDEGRRSIEFQISYRLNRDVVTQLRHGLRVVADETDRSELQAKLEKVSAHLITLAERRIEELTQLPSDPDSELMLAIDGPPESNEAHIGAIAGLARRAGERDDWEAAATWYERIEESRDVFPEVKMAFDKVASAMEGRAHDRLGADDVPAAKEALEMAIRAGRRAGRSPTALATMRQTLGDALLRRNETDAARAQYASALRLVAGKETTPVTALNGRAAIADDLRGLPDPRWKRLASALHGYAATGETEPGEALGELARSLIGSADAYARLDSAWAIASNDPALPADLRPAVVSARAALVGALDDVLGMNRIPEDLFPVVTPIVLEIGDALVPIVDSRQDGGHFLFELLPAMRDRILATTGVTVPGVRARGNPALGPNDFSLQVDEIPVAMAALDAEGRYVAIQGRRRDTWLTDCHPLTGVSGLWAILLADTVTEEGDQLTAADVLVHHIERAVRSNLRRYLGPQEVSGLVTGWAELDEKLASQLLPDDDAQLRLTWVLQALADDAIPLTDWKAILSGIRDAGGVGVPIQALHRALRLHLRDLLPGPNTGLVAVPLPAEHEAALGSNGTVTGRLEFRRWLKEYVATSGSGIALVSVSSQSRELASDIASAVDPLIKTLTQEELNGQGAASRTATSGPGSP